MAAKKSRLHPAVLVVLIVQEQYVNSVADESGRARFALIIYLIRRIKNAG
jgi:hypothetical protein